MADTEARRVKRWWENPDSIAKRRATFRNKRVRKARVLAERVMRRWVPDPADAAACRAWLEDRGVKIEDPNMRPADRLRWVRRARTLAPR